jgi:hypothetical protein
MVPNQLSWGSLYTTYILHCGAITNYCVFDCQSTDFVDKTGESEYAQEIVEMSFGESRKFPRHIPKHFHFQLYKLWDIYKISCIRL